MKKDDCIFCKIANGEILSRSIYEDKDFKVIMDLSPATKGHSLILPKNHAENIYELSEEDASKVFIVAKKVACMMKEKLHCDGFNLIQNNGEIAGQTIFHFHMHLIPRYNDDEQKITAIPRKVEEAELDKIYHILMSEKE